jgi:hypothetical protein
LNPIGVNQIEVADQIGALGGLAGYFSVRTDLARQKTKF